MVGEETKKERCCSVKDTNLWINERNCNTQFMVWLYWRGFDCKAYYKAYNAY